MMREASKSNEHDLYATQLRKKNQLMRGGRLDKAGALALRIGKDAPDEL